MTRLDPAPDRRRERVVGGLVVLVGIAVLVLSIVALVGAVSGTSSDVAGPSVRLPGGSGTAAAPSSGPPSATPSPSTSPTAGATPSTTGSATSTATASAPASSPAAAGRQPLVVLNNTRSTGLAQQAATTFTQGGWTVTDTGNIDQSTISTCAYYDPAVAGAQAAAEALMKQFPAIKRTAPKYGALPAGPVVVVLTDDYTAR